MNTEDDCWASAAFSDDTLVAELLCRLNQPSSQPQPPPPPAYAIFLALPLGWGQRQLRSKPKKVSPCAVTAAATTTARCSPTTPLSWSGGGGGVAASPSDGDYCSNSNSSRLSSDLSRSKGACTNDAANIYAHSKRLKKKTFTQLKQEESVLLDERVTLQRELASMHVTLEEQRVRSENLKRIKLDLNLHTSAEMCTTSSHHTEVVGSPNRCNQTEVPSSDLSHPALPRDAAQDGYGLMGSCTVEKEVATRKGRFALPDLNMMPSEEEEDIGRDRNDA